MSPRRLLLIDTDPDFHQLLLDRLGPYGFEIHQADEANNPLGQIPELKPELIFIAVEMPNKVGYSLCNKAKKGVARDIPVVLTTSTVPASGFYSHRKLKVHADEYIDKRTMDPEAVAGAIDQLIGLGDLIADPEGSSGNLAVETEDLSLSDDLSQELYVDEISASELDGADQVQFADQEEFDVELSEGNGAAGAIMLDDFGGATGFDPAAGEAGVDAGIDAETDVAFDLLRSDEVSAAEIDDDVSVDEVGADAMVEEVGAEELSADHRAAASAGESGRRGKAASEAARDDSEFDLDAIGEFQDEESPTVFEEPPPRTGRAAPPPHATPPAAAQPATAGDAGLDLGLDEVAAIAHEEQSGLHDPRTLHKMHLLESENSRLRTELESLKKAPSGAGDAFSREREFLNLREIINKKEKELLDLRDEISRRDREILDGKERLARLERDRAELDSKHLALEQKLLESNQSLRRTEKELAARTGELETARTQSAGVAAELADARETATRRETEHASAIAQLETQQRTALGELEARLRREQETALATLRREHESALAELRREQETALAALRDQHATALQSREEELRRKDQLLVAAEEAHRDALAAAEKQAAEKQQAAEAELERTRKSHEAQLASREAEQRERLGALERKHADELTALREAHERTLAERAAAAESARKALEEQLAAAESRHREEQTRVTGELRQAREALEMQTGRVRTLEGELDALRGEASLHKQQIADAMTRLLGQDDVMRRAKKAVAIALTLLDNQDTPRAS